jgi:fluoride ion exporter CrcB/FEX
LRRALLEPDSCRYRPVTVSPNDSVPIGTFTTNIVGFPSLFFLRISAKAREMVKNRAVCIGLILVPELLDGSWA